MKGFGGCQGSAREPPGGGSHPASPLAIPGETLPYPAVQLVPRPWGDCYSAAVAIFIFQLSQEEQGSNIYMLAFYSGRPVTKIMSGGFSQMALLEQPCNLKALFVALNVIMGEMRNKMCVEELFLGSCPPWPRRARYKAPIDERG